MFLEREHFRRRSAVFEGVISTRSCFYRILESEKRAKKAVQISERNPFRANETHSMPESVTHVFANATFAERVSLPAPAPDPTFRVTHPLERGFLRHLY